MSSSIIKGIFSSVNINHNDIDDRITIFGSAPLKYSYKLVIKRF